LVIAWPRWSADSLDVPFLAADSTISGFVAFLYVVDLVGRLPMQLGILRVASMAANEAPK
jgi:hypothetical protein